MRSSKTIGLLHKSIREAERRALGKVTKPVLGATGKKHFPRQNPETKTVNITVRNCNRLGCINNPSGTLQVYNRTYTSVNTPGFIGKRKAGQLPVNPYTLSRMEIQPGTYDVKELHANGDFETAAYNVFPLLTQTDIPAGHLPVDENLLINKIRGRITATAKIGESLAQGHQTAHLMSTSLSRMKTFLQVVTGGTGDNINSVLGRTRGKERFVKAVKFLRRDGLNGSILLARLWLEYRYGWLPLVEDVQQTITAFQQYAGKNSDIARVSGKRRVEATNMRSVLYASNPNSVPQTYRTRYYYETRRTTCRMGFTYSIGNKMLATINGLGLTSPVSLAWDLVPYSFLVDWFYPIGPALDAMSAYTHLAFARGYKTYFTESTVLCYVDQSFSLAGEVYSEKGKSFGTRVLQNRVALTSFPHAVMPRMKNPFSFVHAANAAALITLLLTGNKIRRGKL